VVESRTVPEPATLTTLGLGGTGTGSAKEEVDFVIPVKTGIQMEGFLLDSCLRRNDEGTGMTE